MKAKRVSMSSRTIRLARNGLLLWAAAAVAAPATATVWRVKPVCTVDDGATCSTTIPTYLHALLQPGDTLTIYNAGTPEGYTHPTGAALSLDGVLGTAAAPIQVLGVGKPLIRQTWVNASAHLQISGLDVYAAPRAEPVLAIADSTAITLSASDVHGGGPQSNGINLSGAAVASLTVGPGNRVYGNGGNGIALRADGVVVPGAPLGAQVLGNEVFGNRSHGIDIEASHWRVEGNFVHDNGPQPGDAQGGYSGIHLYRPAPSAGQPCDGNEVLRNFVSGQRELSAYADGNGIQIDHFCDGNTVGFNAVWGNAGAGVNLFAAGGNSVLANTLFHNNQRSHWPLGTEFGELTLSGGFACPGSGQVRCTAEGSPQACVPGRPYICSTDGLQAARGHAAHNLVRDNLIVADPALVLMPSVRVTATFVNPASGNRGNQVWATAYATEQGQPDPGMPKLLWVDTVYNDVDSINAVTGATTAAQQSTLGAVRFMARATPQTHGLRLAKRPAFEQKGYALDLADLCGVLPPARSTRFGAYYFPNAADCGPGFPALRAR
jgi:hypothetical protein